MRMHNFASLAASLLVVTSQVFGQGTIIFGGDEQSSEVAANRTEVKDDIEVRTSPLNDNCRCQCSTYSWTDGRRIFGNCKSADGTGALFCYINDESSKFCSDTKVSKARTDQFGRQRLYSYEACSVPPKHLCGRQTSRPPAKKPVGLGSAFSKPDLVGIGGFFGTRSDLDEDQSEETASEASAVTPEVIKDSIGDEDDPVEARR